MWEGIKVEKGVLRSHVSEVFSKCRNYIVLNAALDN